MTVLISIAVTKWLRMIFLYCLYQVAAAVTGARSRTNRCCLVFSHRASLRRLGRHHDIFVAVDTRPILLDINTLPPLPPSLHTVWIWRGHRCLGGVWVACVADTPSMVDRLQEQQGENERISCLTFSQTLKYFTSNITPLHIS